MSLPAPEKIAKLTVLLFDVDGVMTDGGLYVGEDGTALKRFDIRDGAGLVLARRAGYRVGIISGHDSPATRARAEKLGLDVCRTGTKEKLPVFREVLEELGATPEETLFMGDDLFDLPVLKRAGYAVAVPAAPAVVRDACDHTTTASGGRGAVRELVDELLTVTGRWEAVLEEFE